MCVYILYIYLYIYIDMYNIYNLNSLFKVHENLKLLICQKKAVF